MEDSGAKGAADVSLSLARVVQEAQLEGNESIATEVDALNLHTLRPIPDVQVSSVQT